MLQKNALRNLFSLSILVLAGIACVGKDPGQIAQESTPTANVPPADQAELPQWFGQIEQIPRVVANQMKGLSWHPGCPVPLEDLSYLTVTYQGFDGETHRGHLIVHDLVAEEVLEIFREVFETDFPIESMKIVSEFGGSDSDSMNANNTSAFNCRPITGNPGKFSLHSYGIAIDINPVQNPYIKGTQVLPKAGSLFLNRSEEQHGMIAPSPLAKHWETSIYSAFRLRGWDWGGDWEDLKDFQHFEKSSLKTRLGEPTEGGDVPKDSGRN